MANGRNYELAALLERAEENGAHIVVIFPQETYKPDNIDALTFAFKALDLTTNTWLTEMRSVSAYEMVNAKSLGPAFQAHVLENALHKFGAALAFHVLGKKPEKVPA